MTELELMRMGDYYVQRWTADWVLLAEEAFGCVLDDEQKAILRSVQKNPRTSVASGTARGKDYIAAVAALCFFYTTPKWDDNGILVENTKVALTAPTDRQVKDIMMPEVSRLYNAAKRNGLELGRLMTYDIRTDDAEWFLTGFKADEHNTEAWTGFHAVNTMFVVTEATGMAQKIWDAIEGNLQGNSRLLIVFNPNSPTGYAAQSQKSKRWSKFRLNSLHAQNVVEKRIVIPGQVDYEWVKDKIEHWCSPISEKEFNEGEGDFMWEGRWYRPSDLFRIKILGLFPKEGEDALIPSYWIELANERWEEWNQNQWRIQEPLRLGVDVAGMGRDSSCFCPRYGKLVKSFTKINSGGKANHMEIAGRIVSIIKSEKDKRPLAMVDTIGEGAGVYSRTKELGYENVLSCKYSESAEGLKDVTEQYSFANMRAYLHWAVRDWLNPINNTGAMLPPNDEFKEEASEIKWKFQSNGKVIIEPKEDIIKRLKRSPDMFDSLANTFYPAVPILQSDIDDIAKIF